MISKEKLRFCLKKIHQVIYWVAPPVLLYLILKRIDPVLFFEKVKGVNPWLLALGIAYYPIVVLVSGIRWKVALAEYFGIRPPLAYLVRHYWIGMVIGYFSPGQLGLDAYRVVTLGRRYHHYLRIVFTILSEKVMALLNAALMVLCLFPLVKALVVNHGPELGQIVSTSYVVALIALLMMGIFFLAGRRPIFQRFFSGISALIIHLARRVRGATASDSISSDAVDSMKIAELLSRPRPFLLVFAASLAIQIISAAGNQIIFRAAGYDIPFLVNLFVMPIFYFVFLLPISFGSLGIREGAYILLYGFFGVPSEMALLASFINLFGVLLNNAIGACLLLLSKPKKFLDNPRETKTISGHDPMFLKASATNSRQ